MNGKLGYAGGRMIENIGPRLCCRPDANKETEGVNSRYRSGSSLKLQVPTFGPEYFCHQVLSESNKCAGRRILPLPHKNLYHDIQQGEIRGTNWNFQDNNQISLTPQSRPGTYIRSYSHRNFQENSETTETSRSAPSMLERIVNRKLGIS